LQVSKTAFQSDEISKDFYFKTAFAELISLSRHECL